MIDPFTGDLQALQDANRLIDSLKAKLQDREIYWVDAVRIKTERIVQLEEFVKHVATYAEREENPYCYPGVETELELIVNAARELLEKGNQ